jgi:hypothetical protein
MVRLKSPFTPVRTLLKLSEVYGWEEIKNNLRHRLDEGRISIFDLGRQYVQLCSERTDLGPLRETISKYFKIHYHSFSASQLAALPLEIVVSEIKTRVNGQQHFAKMLLEHAFVAKQRFTRDQRDRVTEVRYIGFSELTGLLCALGAEYLEEACKDLKDKETVIYQDDRDEQEIETITAKRMTEEIRRLLRQ